MKDELDSSADLRRHLRALRAIFGLYWWGLPAIVLVGVAASLAEGVGLSLFLPLIETLDEGPGTGGGTWWTDALASPLDDLSRDDRVVAIGLCIFGLIALRAALDFVNVLIFAWLDAHIGHRLRSGILRQLLEVEQRFVERSDTGQLLNTLSTETWRTSDAMAVTVSLLVSIVNMVVYVTLLLLLSAELTLVVGTAMGGIALLVRWLTRRVERLGRESTRANATLAARMVEGLTLNALIRAFGRQDHEQERFDDASRHVSGVMFRIRRLSGSVAPVYQLLSGALLVGVVIVTLRDTSELSSLLVFLFVLYRLQPQVIRVNSAIVRLRSLGAAVEDVAQLLDPSDKRYLANGVIEHVRLWEGITFDHVTYRYDDGEAPALDDVCVEIPAGRVTAVVGPSGAGKSTLVKLLLRAYDPSEGRVLVDGRPLPELDVASWRRSLAVVIQEVQLFSASVADNIRYGNLTASDEEVRAAASSAAAHDFVMRLPQRYDTQLGDNGIRLSGGQQQRISLARAIVRDPEVLILDEATNALDSPSERLIQEALDVLGEGRTVVVIAHRFSTIERADHVIVLDGGRVVQAGERSTLLAEDGLFRRLAENPGGARP